jgi:hypothetical protein
MSKPVSSLNFLKTVVVSPVEKYIYVMGFDIGLKNFAIWCDRFKESDIASLKIRNTIPLKNRYTKNNECLPEFSKILNSLCSCGERVYVDKKDLSKDGDKRVGKQAVITNKVLVRLTNYLEDLNVNKKFDNIDYFVIEQQMKTNPTALQLQYHLRAYLIMLFLNFKPIISFPSKYKTHIFGAPKTIFNEKQNKMVKLGTKKKKWASDKVFSILTSRNDIIGLKDMYSDKKYGKCDDCADALLHVLAFVYMVLIDNKINFLDN